MKRKHTILIPLIITLVFLTSMPLCASAALMKSNGEQYTASAEDEAQKNLTPVHADQVAEGTYPVTVISSTSMFRVTDAVLTVSAGSMSARITLGGTAYSHLYMGTDTDAAKSDESQRIPYEENDDGSYSYTIPVEALNKEIDCAAFSTRSNKWFPRTLIFEASSLPEGTVRDITSPDTTEETQKAALYTGSDSTASKKDSYKKAASVKDSRIGYAEAAMEDGEYKIPVTLTGGSGRAAIESPAAMVVKDQHARAEIRWSSPNYDYMVVDGLLYEPVNEDGNSVFEIPVTQFDGEMKVIADTTAMSQPHEIEYVLNFDSSQAELQELSVKIKGIILLVIFVLIVIAGFIRGYLRRGKSDYDMQTAEELQKNQSSAKTVSKKKKKKKKRR